MKFNFWEGMLLILFMIVSNIISFPCFLLQLAGFKAKRYANWLSNVGFDQLTLYDIKVYKM